MKALMAALALVALPATAFAATSEQDVLSHYADLAHAKYEDSLISARTLQGAVNQFVAEPTEANLANAKDAWLAARVPYQQSEVYRFGNAIVDDWEGKVNAWPLDEGLIDYVAASYGAESEENPRLSRQRRRQPELHLLGRDHRCQQHHQGAARRYATRARRRRGKRGDGLPRHRVPALGPGPERHRPRRRRAARQRLRPGQLLLGQLRPPCRLSADGHRSAD